MWELFPGLCLSLPLLTPTQFVGLHNMQGPVLNENVGPLVKMKNFKMVIAEH